VPWCRQRRHSGDLSRRPTQQPHNKLARPRGLGVAVTPGSSGTRHHHLWAWPWFSVCFLGTRRWSSTWPGERRLRWVGGDRGKEDPS
jgi:hypothetical protein